jgi:2-iminobutanoate/2-iminopropanoate deaminase
MEVRTANSPAGPRPVGPYSHAVIAGEQLVFCSGMVAVDPATNALIDGDVAAHTGRAIDNLEASLAAAGSDLAHVVKTTVFLTDLADFKAMNEEYARRFGGHKPARSTVQVAALPLGARLEIECIAVRK